MGLVIFVLSTNEVICTINNRTHIDNGGFVTGVLLHPAAKHCEPPGVTEPQ